MLKTFGVYFPAVALPRLTAFLVVLAGTHLLAPDQFGYLSLTILIGEFADTAISNWLRIATIRFGRRADGISRRFVQRMALLAGFCTVVAMLLSLAAVALLAPEVQLTLSIATVTYILSAATVRYGVTIQMAAGNHQHASLFESIRAIGVLFAGPLMMVLTGSFFAVSLLSSGVGIVIGAFAIRTGWSASHPHLRDDTSSKALLMFAVPLIVLALLSQLIGSLDKALLKLFQDVATLGYYSASFMIGRAGFDILANSFNRGAFIRLSEHFNQGSEDQAQALLSQQLAYIVSVALPLATVLIASRDTIARALLPTPYFETFIQVVPIVAVGAIALNLKNFVYDNIFHLHLKNLRQIPTLVVGAIVTAGLGLWLLPLNPVFGAAMMFAGGSMSALVMSIGLSRALVSIPVPWQSILVSICLAALALVAVDWLRSLMPNSVPDFVLLGALMGIGLIALALSLLMARLMTAPIANRVALGLLTPAPNQVSGISSYAESLFDALAAHPNRPDFLFFTNATDEIFPRLQDRSGLKILRVPSKPRWLPYRPYVILMQLGISIMAKWKGCQCYVSAAMDGSLLPVTPQIVTLHDLYEINRHYRSWRRTAIARALWPLLARVSRHVICVSDTTKREALDYMPFAESKLVVIKEGSRFSVEVGTRSHPTGPFLFVANVAETKNAECLLNALKLAQEQDGEPLDVDWIGRDMLGIVKAWTRLHGAAPGLRPRGFVSEEALKHSYQEACALVVPSWTEGFCLPVVEAQSFALPVIASDIPILHEVAGEGALFFDPHDPAMLLAQMRRLRDDPELVSALSAAARANARQYSWEKAATETLDLLKDQTWRT